MSRMPQGGWPAAEMDQLYAMAPLQLVVAQWEVKKRYGNQFTLDQYRQVMGPLLDYYTDVMLQAEDAVGLSFDQQLQLAEKAAAIDPENCYGLAKLYQDHHQDDKAAAAYQEWFDKGLDRVSVSSRMAWLVNYYYDHGKTDKALAIAQDGAEVYSYLGLKTMMDLQEKMGHLDDAEDYGQKILDRYQDQTPLTEFLKRHADKGDAGFQAKFDQAASALFPNGMKKVTLAALSGPPTTGIRFVETTDAMKAVGLSSDLVVIALDGYGVETEQQYAFVRSLSDSPVLHFIVWDGKSYRELDANCPGRRFGVHLQPYHP
jgi:tetratricopeptide (TPR) repeat protein